MIENIIQDSKARKSIRRSLEKYSGYQPFAWIAKQTRLRAGHMIIFFSLTLTILIYFDIFSLPIYLSVSLAYPTYKTFQTIDKDPDTNEMRFWLKFWIVFSFLAFVNPILLATLHSLRSIYLVGRLLITIYLYHPSARGAAVLYDRFVRDILKRYEVGADELLDRFINGSKHRKKHAINKLKEE
jgi:hypothetical protein